MKIRTLVVALSLLVLPSVLMAQPATLAKDLNTTRTGGISDILDRPWFVQLGGIVLFGADDGRYGHELWRSDGTEAGTALVRDICPGVCPSRIVWTTVAGSQAFFAADDGAHGRELWVTDGTTAGTRMVADLAPGLADSNPYNLQALGSRLLFSIGHGPTTSRELWISDGTAAGTNLLADIEPGPGQSEPAFLGTIGSIALFAAGTAGQGRELWRTDGTAAGTTLVADLNPGTASSLTHTDNPFPGARYAVANGGRVFFPADDGTHGVELWVSDGTAAGTMLVKDIHPSNGSNPNYLVPFGSGVVFTADDGANGTEIWTSDGTAAGTTLVQDINPGPTSSGPNALTTFAGRIYFRAFDATHGRELWVSDGTASGTSLVVDLYPGTSGGLIYLPPAGGVGSSFLFYADDAVHGAEFWKTDGTPGGTSMLADINPGAPSSYLTNLSDGFSSLVANGRLYFSAYTNSDGFEVWTSDGTVAGTQRLRQINDQATAFPVEPLVGALYGPRLFGDLGGTLLFGGDDGSARFELRRSDGTAAGTVPVSNGSPGTTVNSPVSLTPFGGALLFNGDDGVDGSALWRTDGTAAGTFMVQDLDPANPNSGGSPRWLTPLGAKVVFAGPNDALWTTDGTTAGTQPVGAAVSVNGPMAALGPAVLFSGYDGTQYELWRSDGTPAGTARIFDLSPGTDSGNPSSPVVAGGLAFFTATTPATGTELWKSDGTAAGTSLVKDIQPGSGSGTEPGYPNDDVDLGFAWAALGNRVVFAANDGTSSKEPWVSDGTPAGTAPLGDLFAGSRGSEPLWITAAAGKVFFVADDGVHGRELWTTDGTPTGTAPLLDIASGAGSSLPTELRAVGRLLLFNAWDSVHGREPWVSDGTPAGTRRVQDIAPGVLSSSPMGFFASGSKVYFVANDNTTGFELWSLPKSALGPALVATKTASGFFYEGGTVTYTIQLANQGLTLQPDLPGAELTDVVPAGLTVTGVGTTGQGIVHVEADQRTVTWNGALAAGDSVLIGITATVNAGTLGSTLANQATLSWDADGDGVNEATGVSDDPLSPAGNDPTPITIGPEALGFYTVPPCRVLDTRQSEPLTSGVVRVIGVVPSCGIPSTARAIAANLTIVGASGTGSVVVWRGHDPMPGTSNVNFRVGVVRGNNAIIGLGGGGAVEAMATINGGGTVNLIVDVSGYFQ